MRIPRKHIGFTLIELLVVIAIIAILAAILFPVFAQAREKARQANCLSNIKQIALAAMIYIQDYDETYPGGPGFGTTIFYPGPKGSFTSMPTSTSPNIAPDQVSPRLITYIKSPGIFVDPDDPTGDRLAAGRWDAQYTRAGYWWHGGLSRGYSQPSYPSGTLSDPGVPFSLVTVSKPALLQMVQDNWADYHSGSGPRRWNVGFADGHVKFTLYVDGNVPSNQRPWIWNFYNPSQPQNLEQPCSPTCAAQAASGG